MLGANMDLQEEKIDKDVLNIFVDKLKDAYVTDVLQSVAVVLLLSARWTATSGT